MNLLIFSLKYLHYIKLPSTLNVDKILLLHQMTNLMLIFSFFLFSAIHFVFINFIFIYIIYFFNVYCSSIFVLRIIFAGSVLSINLDTKSMKNL